MTADGQPVVFSMTGENNSAIGEDNHIAYGHGWFTADLDSRGLRNLEVMFNLVSEAPVDVHISDGGVGLTNIALGLATPRVWTFPPTRVAAACNLRVATSNPAPRSM